MSRIRGLTRGIPVLAVLVSPSMGGPPDQEVERLVQMSGCFEVTYRFAEDGRHDAFSPDYGLEEPVTEWIALERQDDTTFVMTHVGVRQGVPVPHFREIWTYSALDGRWTHEIWNRLPDDPNSQLRYACETRWERNRWECAAGRAEKPFRDSGAPFGFDRTDYDWLDRTNILLVTSRGWIHNQHNKKMAGEGRVVSYELGWITYARVDRATCGSAPERFPSWAQE